MSICLIAGGKAVAFAAAAFTLSWTHSVEKILWEEDWRLTKAGLEIAEARVRGSGAGMEVPEGAILQDGAWRYRPDLQPQASLTLASSGATASGWRLCGETGCREVGAASGETLTIAPCRANPAAD